MTMARHKAIVSGLFILLAYPCLAASNVNQTESAQQSVVSPMDSLPYDSVTISVPVDSVLLSITSTPDSGMILVDGIGLDLKSPGRIVVPAGEHVVEVYLSGYEPLADTLEIESGQALNLDFLLSPLPPQPMAAESLGLLRLPILKPIDEKHADRVKAQWTALAEAFAVMPLGQGVVARIALSEDHRTQANALILTGIGLSVGSWIASKILFKRKLRQIRRRNEEIPGENRAAQRHNLEVEQLLAEANASAVDEWLEASMGTGKVTVTPLVD
jgi:hypothetical protein